MTLNVWILRVVAVLLAWLGYENYQSGNMLEAWVAWAFVSLNILVSMPWFLKNFK